jgi:hypothetical protein
MDSLLGTPLDTTYSILLLDLFVQLLFQPQNFGFHVLAEVETKVPALTLVKARNPIVQPIRNPLTSTTMDLGQAALQITHSRNTCRSVSTKSKIRQ